MPADERFYAGGGGSVRGVPFQKAGPLDRHGDPVGGRSFVELSTELRLSITETIGLVAFLDTGSAYPESLPDPAAGLRWRAGSRRCGRHASIGTAAGHGRGTEFRRRRGTQA